MSTIILLITVGLLATGQSVSSAACSKKLDLLILIDGSSSICGDPSCPEWGLSLQFVQNIVASFNIGKDDTRVGLVTVSSQGNLVIDFNQYLDKDALLSAIANVAHPGGEIDSIVSIAKFLTSLVTAAISQRSDATVIAIVVTDGAPSLHNTGTVLASTAIQAIGMNVFMVCVTDRCIPDIAKSMSSPPKQIDQTYYVVKDYSSFGDIVDNLVKQICAFKKPSLLGGVLGAVSTVLG